MVLKLAAAKANETMLRSFMARKVSCSPTRGCVGVRQGVENDRDEDEKPTT